MVDLTDGSGDTAESAAAFTDEAGSSYPLSFDTDFSGAAAYAVNAIPLTVFVDAEGCSPDSPDDGRTTETPPPRTSRRGGCLRNKKI